MTISTIASTGSQPPSLASLLQINRINPITGRDSEDAKEVSGLPLPKAGVKEPVIPKLVQDVFKTLSQMGASISGGKPEGVAKSGAHVQDIKKNAMDFLTSVISAVKPKVDGTASNSVGSLEQLNDGISKMIGAVDSGAYIDASVVQSAEKLIKASGLSSNANTLGGLLQGLQSSLLDDSGTGSLVNITA